MNKKRVGIFGGTFNPPHIGHVQAAKAFVEKINLDLLLIMPAFIPPHKDYLSTVSYQERFEMCKIAFADVSNASVSDIEISRGGKSYTYLTLKELTKDDVELYLLCGTDMILSMDTWMNPQIIFSLATICYIRRENSPETTSIIEIKCREYIERFNARIVPINSEVIEISSSEIRVNEIKASKFLDERVLAYIVEKGLYK